MGRTIPSFRIDAVLEERDGNYLENISFFKLERIKKLNLCGMIEKWKPILDAEEQFEFDVKNIMFIIVLNYY